MNSFDRYPQAFRIIFGSVGAFLALFAGYIIYEFGRSPSDENLFQDPPSRAYVTQTIPAELLDKPGGLVAADSLRAGDLVWSVNGKRFPSLKEGLDYVRSLDSNAVLTLVILRPPDGKFLYQVRKSRIPLSIIQERQPTALVIDVTPGGASDRAGMKVGDHILQINGQTFKNVAEADAILTRGQIGKTIDYEILRGNETMTLHVTLAAFGLQFAFLVFILCALILFLTGVFLGEARPQFAATRLLGIFFTAVGYFMVVQVASRGLDSPWALVVRTWTLRACSFAIFPVLLHSMHYFPQDRPELIRRKWIRLGGYGLSLIAIIAGVNLHQPWGQILFFGSGVYIFVVTFIYRKECAPVCRRANRAVRWAGISVAIAAAVFGILAPSLGGVLGLKLVAWFGVILLALPAAYLYTIGRYRLFNLALRVRRSVQYTVVAVVWTVVLIVAFSATLSLLVQSDLKLPYLRITSSSIEITNTPASEREQTLVERAILAGLAIAAASIMMRLHRSGGRMISEKFYRTRYDYRRAANELAEAMSSTLNMTQLAKGIVEKLASLMRLKRVGMLFFRDQQACCCHEAYGFDGSTWDEFCIKVDDHMVDGLKEFNREVSVGSLPAPLGSTFKAEEFHFVVPIRSKEKLVGALLIGEKMSESAFTPEDLEFLGAVAKQASVAIENAFLYEELAEQERLKHELAIARKIQLESLPQSTPAVEGLEISGISIPALEVGGDYFDYLNGDATKLTVIVGDVSGKGTSAALYMSKVQGILRSLHAFGLSPRELFIRANHLLCRDLEKKSFVTAMGAAFDTNKQSLVLARAGHLPLFHYAARTRKVMKITPRGLGLGLSPEELFATELEERCVSYGPGDIFVFVTDGITEGQQRTGDEYGEERLLKMLEESSGTTAVALRDRIIEEVKSFAGDASQHDDQTVVVVKVTGPA